MIFSRLSLLSTALLSIHLEVSLLSLTFFHGAGEALVLNLFRPLTTHLCDLFLSQDLKGIKLIDAKIADPCYLLGLLTGLGLAYVGNYNILATP